MHPSWLSPLGFLDVTSSCKQYFQHFKITTKSADLEIPKFKMGWGSLRKGEEMVQLPWFIKKHSDHLPGDWDGSPVANTTWTIGTVHPWCCLLHSYVSGWVLPQLSQMERKLFETTERALSWRWYKALVIPWLAMFCIDRHTMSIYSFYWRTAIIGNST